MELQRKVCGAVEKKVVELQRKICGIAEENIRELLRKVCVAASFIQEKFVQMKCFLEKRLLYIKERLYNVHCTGSCIREGGSEGQMFKNVT